MEDNFTLDYYQKCICLAQEQGYEFITSTQAIDVSYPPEKLVFIMRHDVDHNLDLAVRMAQLENKLNISSTYYFRTQARNYNVFSWPNIKLIHMIKDFGHEIGYHYELPLSTTNENRQFFTYNVHLLRLTFGMDTIRTICPHEPTRVAAGDVINASLRKHLHITCDAYDAILMDRFKYISDSSCRWREGPLHKHITARKSLYVLTHPVWWYENNPGECY